MNSKPGHIDDKYIHNSYDQIVLRIRKDGEMTRADIQEAADHDGKSLNQFILDAVREKIEAK